LHVADSAVLFTGPYSVPLSTSYYPPAQGSGSRMMWYPQKAAFRTGYVFGDAWDFAHIGKWSIATGNSTEASGEASTAMGYNSIASGYSSTAMGGGIASGNLYSTAMGTSTASGNYSTAMGRNTTALADFSTAMGYFTIAKSFAETSIGSYNTDYNPLSTQSWNAADRLFTIGNGVNGFSRSNALVVLKNGNTGLGTSTPTYKLHLGSSNNGLRIEGPATTGIAGSSALNIGGAGDIIVDAPNVVGGRFLIKENGNVGISNNVPAYKLDVFGDINAAGQVRASGVVLLSDERFKQNITTLPNALNQLLQLRGTNYFFNTTAYPERNFSGDKQLGVIAQEVEKVFPDLVTTGKDGYKSVNYIGLIPVMIESIKEQQKQIETLTKMVNQLLNK
jgi:hypothetical protein